MSRTRSKHGLTNNFGMILRNKNHKFLQQIRGRLKDAVTYQTQFTADHRIYAAVDIVEVGMRSIHRYIILYCLDDAAPGYAVIQNSFQRFENQGMVGDNQIVPGFYGFIHYFFRNIKGEKRTGRFIMNAMLASGGYPWTIIPVARKPEYMAALEEASSHENARPLASFIAELVAAPPPPRPDETGWPTFRTA